MSEQANVYQKDGLGWFIELADRIEGPLDSCEEAQNYLKLVLLAGAARTGFACLDRECLV